MSQKLRLIEQKKPWKSKGIWISKRSIGTMWVGSTPYTYNSNLVYKNQVTIDKIVEDSQPKKKIILIKRK